MTVFFASLHWLWLLQFLQPTIAQGMLNLKTDLTLRIEPACSKGRVQAMNEARWGYGKLREAYLADEVPVWLDNAIRRWFGFDFESEFVKHMDLTILRMASVNRVFGREGSRYALYCESAPGIAGTVSLDDGGLIYHKPSALLYYPEEVPCKDGEKYVGVTVNAFPKVRERRLPGYNLPTPHRAVIHRCDVGVETIGATLRDLAAKGEIENQLIIKFQTDTSIFAHELAHVSELSRLDLGFGQAVHNPKYGKDMHQVYDANGAQVEERSGYYTPKDKDAKGKFLSCAEKLRLVEFALLNPDSYSWLLQEFLMYMYGWEVWVDENGNLRWRRNGRTEEEIKAFGSWPTGQSPNWTDEPTIPVLGSGSTVASL